MCDFLRKNAVLWGEKMAFVGAKEGNLYIAISCARKRRPRWKLVLGGCNKYGENDERGPEGFSKWVGTLRVPVRSLRLADVDPRVVLRVLSKLAAEGQRDLVEVGGVLRRRLETSLGKGDVLLLLVPAQERVPWKI